MRPVYPQRARDSKGKGLRSLLRALQTTTLSKGNKDAFLLAPSRPEDLRTQASAGARKRSESSREQLACQGFRDASCRPRRGKTGQMFNLPPMSMPAGSNAMAAFLRSAM